MNFSLFFSFIYVGKIQLNDNEIKVIKITTDGKKLKAHSNPNLVSEKQMVLSQKSPGKSFLILYTKQKTHCTSEHQTFHSEHKPKKILF